MRAPTVVAALAASLTLLGAVASSPAAGPAAHPDAARAAEVRRIRAHFDSVLAELPARDVSRLTAEQRARRVALLDTLRAYRDRGEFPHNYDFPGQAVPYFVDRETGTLCAVAHLMAASGRRDLVERVARANNNVWVPELAADSAFTGWLDASGLTLAEAARIQVPYVIDDPAPTISSNRAYAAGSVVAGGAALGAAIWNARANVRGGSRIGNALGVTAGVAALGLGAAGIGQEGSNSRALGVANVAAGAASLWLSTRGIMRHRHDVAARARAATLAQRAAITPLLPTSREGGAGVAVALTF